VLGGDIVEGGSWHMPARHGAAVLPPCLATLGAKQLPSYGFTMDACAKKPLTLVIYHVIMLYSSASLLRAPKAGIGISLCHNKHHSGMYLPECRHTIRVGSACTWLYADTLIAVVVLDSGVAPMCEN
jgi:hypothetical protein